ncbi:MAG: uroporphyrinogen-III synthase, partial [Blastocatellia bacterium]
MVTRARSQSAEMTARLESIGASVIHYPTIEVVPPSSWEQVDASIERLQDYDWIVFTSANGVEFFLHRLLEKHSDGLQRLAGRVICAIGPGTARALDLAGAVTHVVARDSKAEGALKAIADHVGGEENIRGLRFLLPRARVGRDTLPVGLRKLDAQVDAVETYQTIKPRIDQT